MRNGLNKRLERVAALVPDDELRDDGTPTINDVWRWQLMRSATAATVHFWLRGGESRPEPEEYDQHYLYAHRDVLKTREDAENASEDVLLEALGLSNVEGWGWLQFMVRDLMWFSLIASNWNLTVAPDCDESLGFQDTPELEAQRRARVAFYFIDMMREHGRDPLADVREAARVYMEQNKLDEAAFVEWLRDADEWAYIVYTCESVALLPDVERNPSGRPLYDTKMQAEMMAAMRARRAFVVKV